MKNILEFFTTNYLWFVAVAVVLILALIGYYVDVKKAADDSPFKKVKTDKNQNKQEEVVTEENINNVQVNNNMSLQEMINNSASANMQNMNQDITTPPANNQMK